ncbi:hypothetical protein NUU61_007682 [Penicillium alfredii]|uniref:Uncharacterized protein n=1 Tax=Penicillium alfredii TaxID=1506179 RepID=A0A9W9ER69_9EURO|nr:uncharacterized protein NUU61_007682 [Penicillium alfredii]KAJ5086375.1 hypothetical protein NUU61_007682 [Penicillium alfredii]
MQFTNIAALAFTLFSSGLATPAGPLSPPGPPGPPGGSSGPPGSPTWATTATIQLVNDESGANANVAVPLDGQKHAVQKLWGETSIAQNGLVFASNAMLTAFQQTTVCTITEGPHPDAILDAEHTWASLGEGVVDLCSAYVECRCEGM